jgi:uncharacterized protein (TIRG00374 family)
VYRKRIFDLLKIAVSVVLIVVLLRQVGFAETVGVIAGADWRFLAGAALVSILGVLGRAYRWQILLEGLGVSVPVRELTNLWFIGFLFNNLLPSGLGGDAIRIYELSRLTRRGTAAVSSVFVDRFLGMLALQSLALIALIFSYQIIGPQVSLATLVFFVIGAAVAWMLFNPRLRDLLGRYFSFLSEWAVLRPVKAFYNSMHQYGMAALGKAFLVSLLFNVLLIAMNVLIALSLGAHLSLWYFMLFVPITSLVLILPISLGGLGVREGTYVMLFTQAGMSNRVAFSMSLLVFALGTVMNGIIGGVIYILRGTRGYLEAETPDELPK